MSLRLANPLEIKQYLERTTPDEVRRNVLDQMIADMRQRATLLQMLRTLNDEQPLEATDDNDPDSISRALGERNSKVKEFDKALRELMWQLTRTEDERAKVKEKEAVPSMGVGPPAPTTPSALTVVNRKERRKRDTELSRHYNKVTKMNRDLVKQYEIARKVGEESSSEESSS